MNENKFIVVDELKFDEIKTKKFQNVLNNLKVSRALVVVGDDSANAVKSARNIPVSYTHLDVYKRQIYKMRSGIRSFFRCVFYLPVVTGSVAVVVVWLSLIHI